MYYSHYFENLSIHVFSSTCTCKNHAHSHTAKSSKTSKKSKKKQTAHTAVLIPDHTHLTFGHHKAIIAALALLPHLLPHSAHPQGTDAPSDLSEPAEKVGGACKNEVQAKGTGEGLDVEMNLLLIGLGGGALPMFINKCIPNVSCRLLLYTCTHFISNLSLETGYIVKIL